MIATALPRPRGRSIRWTSSATVSTRSSTGPSAIGARSPAAASRWSALHGLEPYGLELRETDREIYCSVDAPGFDAGDFDVQVCGNSVKISAATQSNDKGTSSRRMQKYVELPVEIEPIRSMPRTATACSC